MRIARGAMALLGVVAVAGCSGGKRDVRVDGVLVAQAIGNYEAPEGPTVTMTREQRPEDIVLPDGDLVRLAIARDASFGNAKALIKRAEAAGKTVVLLVGERFRLKAIKLNDKLKNPRKAIRLVASPDGKACVAPPDNPESKCAEQVYSNHVSTASVREFVREAMRGYQLDEVRVFARPSVEWADVIRAIDGARTCCDGKMSPRVKLANFDGTNQEEEAAANLDTLPPSDPEPDSAASADESAADRARAGSDSDQPGADSADETADKSAAGADKSAAGADKSAAGADKSP